MAILLIGPYADLSIIDVSNHSLIGVDKGAELLHQAGIKYDLAIGDFDGTELLPSQVPLLRYPKQKNESDFELALQYCATQPPQSIVAYGFLDNNRIDHLLNNLLLLAKYSSLPVRLQDANHCIQCYQEGTYSFIGNYRYLSFFAFESALISLDQGFAYPVDHLPMHPRVTKALSNQVKSKGNLTVHKGIIVVIQSNGK